MVTCAERYSSGENEVIEGCDGLKVCVGIRTTHSLRARALLPDHVQVRTFTDMADSMNKYIYGQCNVIAGEHMAMSEQKLRDLGYIGDFKQGEKMFSREPLSLVTNEDDPEWSALVDAVVNIFFVAEAKGITKATARDAFWGGSNQAIETLATSIVSQLGNYGELYDKHLEDHIPRAGPNALYRKDQPQDTGLLYPMPYGNLKAIGGVSPSKQMESILGRGYLRCGLQLRPHFAEYSNGAWSGFDVEMCKALAAALFGQVGHQPTFVVLPDLTSAYSSLLMEEVDVVAGIRVSLGASYKEPTTIHSFQFSPSYFYDASGDPHAMLTTGKDPQWTDFVYWAMISTFDAEEQGIYQYSASHMPLIHLFGEGFRYMFQDLVGAVGSYWEIYDRSLEHTIPRSPNNQINHDHFEGPQHHALPI